VIDLVAGLVQLDNGEPIGQLVGGDVRRLTQR